MTLGRWFPWLLILGLVTNLTGLPVTLMEPDAALYATISKNIVTTGDWVNLIARGSDWLDKPHLPFWLAAASFKLFGVNTIAYKLPALVCWAIGLVYVYLLALRLHRKEVAELAVVMTAFAHHLVLSNNDVRAEPYLVGFITAALYHFIRAAQRDSIGHLVAGAFFAALAVMTKGLFIALPLLGALIFEARRRREWLLLLDARWLLASVFVLLFISPELYCLYQQFDLHPEKVVFGQQGVSGLRFFFWDSQFGRFAGTGPIRSHSGSPLFFTHTILWAFLPWSLALISAVVALFTRRQRPPELYTLGAATSCFLLFSISEFQLPHYLNIIYPCLCIFTAEHLASPQANKHTLIAQNVITAATLTLGAALIWWVLPAALALGLAMLGAALFACLAFKHVLVRACLAAAAVELIFNLTVYPDLLKHQGGSQAAQLANVSTPNPVGMFGIDSVAFELYSERPVARWSGGPALLNASQRSPLTVYARAAAHAELEALGLKARTLGTWGTFSVTRFNLTFLNHRTRATTLREMTLFEVSAP